MYIHDLSHYMSILKKYHCWLVGLCHVISSSHVFWNSVLFELSRFLVENSIAVFIRQFHITLPDIQNCKHVFFVISLVGHVPIVTYCYMF